MALRCVGPLTSRQEHCGVARDSLSGAMQMKIGIIGAGHVGGTLTRRLTALGHDVSVANSKNPETLSDLAAETGAHAVWASDAARGMGVVSVIMPEKSVSSMPKERLTDAAANT